MRYELELPADDEQLEQVLKTLLDSSKEFRHLKEVNWWLCHYYLQGVRSFSNTNYKTGTLDVSFVNEAGLLEFRWDYIVKQYQAELGRLSQLDISPKVVRKSSGLDGVRKASIAQVVLDYDLPQKYLDTVKEQMNPAILKYGCVGLFVWYDREVQRAGIEVVMPWELVPIPPNPMEDGDVGGLARCRMVPLEWVQRMKGVPGTGSKIWAEMDTVEVPRGTRTSEESAGTTTFQSMVQVPQGDNSKGTSKDKTMQKMVELCEIFTKTSDDKLKEYIVLAGGKKVFRENMAKYKQDVPLIPVRGLNTGGFWGRSLISILLPINTEMEWTIGRVFQNIQDLDSMGILCIPTTLGVQAQNVVRAKDGIRRIMYEPDYMAPKDLAPFNLAPANMGMAPMRAIELGVGMSDKLASQPNQMMGGNAPGRVDSSTGLGFLYEISNIPLLPTAQSIAMGLSSCYRVILSLLGREWPKNKVIELTAVEDTLAGVKINAQSGEIKLSDNIIPDPEDVDIRVKSVVPKSREQEKVELQEALKIGAIDMFEYRIRVRKQGIEIPVGNEPEWQNYRRSVMENIQLFGDGKTPGSIIVSDTDMHEVHLRVLDGFMSSPEFYAAGSEVRDAFIAHRKAHMSQFGNFPDQLERPEDAAVMQQQMMKQGGGGMGMPPAQPMPQGF
jgi:hypothetical protein